MSCISRKIKLQRELHSLFLLKFAPTTSSNLFDKAIDYLILIDRVSVGFRVYKVEKAFFFDSRRVQRFLSFLAPLLL